MGLAARTAASQARGFLDDHLEVHQIEGATMRELQNTHHACRSAFRGTRSTGAWL
jgi:hypothetical protein